MIEPIAHWFPNLHWINLLLIPGLLIGYTAHELGRSLTAYWLGDVSQAKNGRITPNPFQHISWFGTLLFMLFGLGWPKPLQFEPDRFKDRLLDSFLVSIAGSAANFAIAALTFSGSTIIVGILTMMGLLSNTETEAFFMFSRTHALAQLSLTESWQNPLIWAITFTNRIWVANTILAITSLVPMPPLDGFTALLSLTGLIKERRLKELSDDLQSPGLPLSISISINSHKRDLQKQAITTTHFKAGTEYHRQQKFDDAIARYRQALQIDPSFGPAYVNIGLAYKAKHQLPEAILAMRGATHYATDEKSKNQAWAELHSLNATSVMPPAPVTSAANNNGCTPWTDIYPTPNWVLFWGELIILLILFVCPLIISLINLITLS